MNWAIAALMLAPGFGTTSRVEIYQGRVGLHATFTGTFNAGTVYAASAYLALPPGDHINFKEIFLKKSVVGQWSRSQLHFHFVEAGVLFTLGDGDKVYFGSAKLKKFTPVQANSLFDPFDRVIFSFNVPLKEKKNGK